MFPCVFPCVPFGPGVGGRSSDALTFLPSAEALGKPQEARRKPQEARRKSQEAPRKPQEAPGSTLGPIHGQILGRERGFEVELGPFSAWGRKTRRLNFWDIVPWAEKRRNSRLDCPSGHTIWPWIGPEVVLTSTVVYRMASVALPCESSRPRELTRRSNRRSGKVWYHRSGKVTLHHLTASENLHPARGHKVTTNLVSGPN